MNVFAKFDEIPTISLQDIKETKRYGHTFGRSFGRTNGQRENSIPSHKSADQLHGNRAADRRLCCRYKNSTIPLIPKSEILSF